MMPYTLPSSTDTRPVVVIGSGTLGRRVGLIWASKGDTVKIVDDRPEAGRAALSWIKEELPARVEAINGSAGFITVHSNTQEAVKDAWLVVECIPEIKAAKMELLGSLDKWCTEDAIITTISSSFASSELIHDVSEMGRSRVLNTHYFMPPEMPPVEMMSCGYTDPSIFDFLIAKLKDIGMDPVIARKESTGFIYGRIWAAIKREIMRELADGVGTPEDIDKLFRYCFKSEGAPCALMDRIGLQTVCNIEDHYIEEQRDIPSYPVEYIRRNYVDKGRLGQSSGQGLFDYSKSPDTGAKSLEQPPLRSRLVGAWELVEYSAALASDPTSKIYPMGRDATGIIMYTPDGYMSAQLQIPGQPPYAVNSMSGATDEEYIQCAKRYLAYTGPFYIDEGGSEKGEEPILTHSMRNCSFPDWMGNTQRRLFEFEEREGERYLTLETEGTIKVGGEERVARLTWRKLEEKRG